MLQSRSVAPDVTDLLRDWRGGDAAALDRLIPLVGDELHRRAARYFRRERTDHTLQPTALVHETYLRLADHRRIGWQNRNHFFCVAARIMRRVLVDHARRRGAAKRGSGEVMPIVVDVADSSARCGVDLIALNGALEELARIAPRQGRIVELRYFGGLTVGEAAAALGVSPATVKLDWSMARAWLFKRLGGGE